MKDQKVIDLHGLHVKEAMHALMNFLDNAEKCKWLHFIVSHPTFSPPVLVFLFQNLHQTSAVYINCNNIVLFNKLKS